MTISEIKRWLWVNNPITIRASYDEDVYHSIRVQIGYITFGDPIPITDALYICRNGIAEVDISGYAKDIIDLSPDETSARAETFRSLFIRIYNDEGLLEYDELHIFVAGGRDIADKVELMNNFAFDTNDGTTLTNILTEFKRPKQFKGYPFELRFCKDQHFITSNVGVTATTKNWGGSTLNTYSDNIVAPTDGIYKTTPDVFVPDANYNHMILQLEGQGLQYTVPLRVDYIRNIKCESVYLRWVNKWGGIDQYLFFIKDKKRPVKTTLVPQPKTLPYIAGYNKGIAKTINKETALQYVIGAEGLDNATFEAISTIARSVRVDIWIGGINWLTVQLSDTDFTTDYAKDYQDIELTITIE